MKNISIVLILFAFLAAACSNGALETPSGIKYTYLYESDSTIPDDGDILLIEVKLVDTKDSVWVDTKGSGQPLFVKKDLNNWKDASKDVLIELWSILRDKDSIQAELKVSDLFMGSPAPVPSNLDSTMALTMNLRVEQVMDQQGFNAWYAEKQRIEFEKYNAEQTVKDIEILNNYFAENNIDAEMTDSGLSYVIHKEGKGREVDPGDTVMVNYTGSFLKGAIFDTSIEKIARENNLFRQGAPYQPYEVIVGQTAVITGWHEALALLRYGSEATVYIPAPLAYGLRGRSGIPPNSILKFDLQIVE